MEEWLKNIIIETLQGASEPISRIAGDLSKSPAAFNPTIWAGIRSISETVVMPIAYVILGLFLMFELYNIAVRTDGMNTGSMSVEIVFRTMFKIVVCKLFLENSFLILDAIFGVSSAIVSGVDGYFSVGGGSLAGADITAIEASIEAMDFWSLLFTALQVGIINLLVMIMGWIVIVIVYGRMIELFVLTAVAPIPIATFPNGEMSQIGKNFLKTYTAVCLQGVFIILVMAIYGILLNSAAGSMDNINGALGEVMIFTLILVVSLFMTGKWAKSVVSAA